MTRNRETMRGRAVSLRITSSRQASISAYITVRGMPSACSLSTAIRTDAFSNRNGRSASRDADPIPTTDHAPPCPCAAGPGNGAAHRCAAFFHFLLNRLPAARIVTA